MAKFRKLWKGGRAGYKRPPMTALPAPLSLADYKGQPMKTIELKPDYMSQAEWERRKDERDQRMDEAA